MSHQMIKKTQLKYDLKDLFLDEYVYSVWSENNEESTDKEESEDLPLMTPLEGDTEEGKKIENFNFEQIVSQTFNIVSTNKSWKRFIQNKK